MQRERQTWRFKITQKIPEERLPNDTLLEEVFVYVQDNQPCDFYEVSEGLARGCSSIRPALKKLYDRGLLNREMEVRQGRYYYFVRLEMED